MKISKIALFIIMSLVIGGFAFTISGCGKSQDKGKVSNRKAIYYCPMHPTYTSDKPGDCPICNMKLVKKEAEPEKAAKEEEHKGHEMALMAPAAEKTLEEVCVEHKCTMNNCPMNIKTGLKPGERIICPICGEVISTAAGKVVEISKQSTGEGYSKTAGPTVTISAEKQQLIGVKTEPVVKKAFTKVIRASGKIAYDPELVVTQEEFIQALKNEDNIKDSPLQDAVDRARSLTNAARNKLKLLGMSDDQIARLKETGKPEVNLYLPGKGENVWAYISVYEYELGLIKVGAPVEIEAIAYPGEIFTGAIASMNPVLDPMTRTNQVRVEIANAEDKLKPEMFVRAGIRADLGEKLVVPENAVLDTGLRKIVYLSRSGDTLESREVKTGQKGEGYYEVLDGLSEGDIVVTSGNFLIDSESKLKSASAGEAGHSQHGQ